MGSIIALVLILTFVCLLVIPIIIIRKISDLDAKITVIEISLEFLKKLISEQSRNDAEQRAEAAFSASLPQYAPETGPEKETEPGPLSVDIDDQAPQAVSPPAAESLSVIESAAAAVCNASMDFVSPPETPHAKEEASVAGREPPPPTYGGEAESWVESRAKRLVTWLIAEGNIWVTVGILLFLTGFGLLFNYAIQRNWISMEVRLLIGAATGIAITGTGWRMRFARRTYALILQGGGIAVLYVVLLAGARFGPVIPPAASIVGMIMLSAFSVIMSILQNFELLAIFALLGGYLAPILVSTGSSNFVALFSIYSLLNFEVLLISLARDWRKTRWGGLVASIVAGTAWGMLRWRNAYFSSVEPFLILFFITYSAISLIPMYRGRLDRFIAARNNEFARADAPMTATLPFVFLFLQMAAASHTKYGVAVTCLALGAWYMALASYSMKRAVGEAAGIEPRIFLIYCILFSNLSVPFIFRQALSSCVSAIEGTLLAACAQRRKNGRLMICGIMLHVFAFLLYNFAPRLHLPSHLYGGGLSAAGLLNWRNDGSGFLLTAIIFAMSAFTASYFADVFGKSQPGREYFSVSRSGLRDALPWILAAYGTMWWTMAAFHAEDFTFSGAPVSSLMILGLGGLAAYEVSARTKWHQIRIAAFPAFAVALCTVFAGYMGRNYALDWLAVTLMSARVFFSYRGEFDKAPDGFSRAAWGFTLFAVISYTSSVWSELASVRFGGSAADLAGYLPIFASALPLLHHRFDPFVKMKNYKSASMAAFIALAAMNLRSFIW